ncbi:MAG: putative cysteine desulfurase [Firmicutes bacterium ADurb.Bin419]|nr:MAG: putative cysteine desulfurase [Firmicutes bacterium ADurb.Bin419]
MDDFFQPANKIRKLYSELIHCNDINRIAILPSVSYGMGIIEKNLNLKKGESIVVIGEGFPSNYYAWEKLTSRVGGILKVIKAPDDLSQRGKKWNEHILDAIDETTRAVCIGNIHWTCGTIYDLKAIRKRTLEKNSLLIIDGSQTVGAFPFSIEEIQPDALVVAGWKWLLGPYSMALGYFGPYFDNGETIEDNWINRKESDQFDRLLYYQKEYLPVAQRYNVGEFSNFTLLPMMINGLEHIIEWGPANIQDYCKNLIKPFVPKFRELGCWIEDDAYRTSHVFGILLPESLSIDTLKKELHDSKVYLSVRGNFIRISPNVYNDKNDIEMLLKVVQNTINMKDSSNSKKVSYGLH